MINVNSFVKLFLHFLFKTVNLKIYEQNYKNVFSNMTKLLKEIFEKQLIAINIKFNLVLYSESV